MEVFADATAGPLDARPWRAEDEDLGGLPELPGSVAAACLRVARYTRPPQPTAGEQE